MNHNNGQCVLWSVLCSGIVGFHLPCCVIVEGFGWPSREGREERRGPLFTIHTIHTSVGPRQPLTQHSC